MFERVRPGADWRHSSGNYRNLHSHRPASANTYSCLDSGAHPDSNTYPDPCAHSDSNIYSDSDAYSDSYPYSGAYPDP